MSERVCLVHYHEIGLKGRNRSAFERRLQSNLDAALVGLPAGRVERIASRQFVRIKDESRALDIAQAMARVPGVAGVSLAYRVSQDPAEQERIALQALKEAGSGRTFKVDARRSNTEFSERSLDINVRIGEVLRLGTDLTVDLTNPDITVSVVVTQNSTYISTVRVPGVGGLPVGTASRVISLLSAGIDSPVATWRMMRRGAVCVGVHFSGRPQTSDASERLVAELGSVLEGTGGLGRVYMVAFGDLQKEISLAVPPDLRVLIYRRLMLKVAERIARVERAKALVTGESLGQVASQTLENIAAVDEVATLPVLRPLIGNDKVEIIAEARAIGTFELSTQDHTDCCTLFMPRNPETHAKMHAVLDAWAMIDADRMVEDAIAGMSWLDFRCTSYRPPKPWPTPAGMVGYSVARYEAGGFAG